MMEELKKKLLDLLGEEGFRTEESMAKHTTFRTGGPADLFLMPQNRTELKESIALLREHNVPYMVIGNGSNLLVGDGGIRGAVIQLYQRMQHISVDGTEMTLDCGALLSAAAAQAASPANGGRRPWPTRSIPAALRTQTATAWAICGASAKSCPI